MDSRTVTVKLLSVPEDLMPLNNTPESAGIDLKSSVDIVLPPNSNTLVSTGLVMEIPTGYRGDIRSRSGLASKHNLHVGAGVIDSPYRGEIKVLLLNLSNKEYSIKRGDRIAQLIICHSFKVHLEVATELTETERGEGGFGSSGYN